VTLFCYSAHPGAGRDGLGVAVRQQRGVEHTSLDAVHGLGDLDAKRRSSSSSTDGNHSGTSAGTQASTVNGSTFTSDPSAGGRLHNVPPISEPDIEALLRAQKKLNEFNSCNNDSSSSSSFHDGPAFTANDVDRGDSSSDEGSGSSSGVTNGRGSLDGGENEVLSSLQQQEPSQGGLRLRFRRMTPMFQVQRLPPPTPPAGVGAAAAAAAGSQQTAAGA